MHKNIFSRIALLLLAVILLSWGTFGHEHINRASVLALPASSLKTFFYNHIDFITQESTIPDLRKYTLRDKAENPRHYVDLENFGGIDSLPHTWEEAQKRYDEKFLQKNGILPWYIEETMEKLTKAFREKRKTEILFLAADLGHYIGDAHMPLHTSANHDGQMTNQKGIHSFWETRLPELFGKDYNYKTAQAHYIDNIHNETWRMIGASHQLKDTVLLTDKKLREKYGNKIYKMDESGNVIKNKFNQPVHTEEYAKEYHTMLGGMVEKQMQKAIEATASYWYTAWVNAGKPDLSDLDPAELTSRNKKHLKEELKLWNKGKLFGIESEREF